MNNMAADELVMQGAKTWSAMNLAYFSGNLPFKNWAKKDEET